MLHAATYVISRRDQLSSMTAPVISANIRTNNTKLASQIQPYHIIHEYSIALIGLTTVHTKTTSSPEAGTEFLDPVEVLQNTVDEINRKERVDRIVAMTHIGRLVLWATFSHRLTKHSRLSRGHGSRKTHQRCASNTRCVHVHGLTNIGYLEYL
jgi:hypothetical protein